MCCSDRCGGRTFWARKDTLLRARSDSTVELGGESLVADAIELVVRVNILLDGLAAVVNTSQSAWARRESRHPPRFAMVGGSEISHELT